MSTWYTTADRIALLFSIVIHVIHDYDVKMPNSAFYGERKQATTKFILLFALELGIQLHLAAPTSDKVSR